MQTDRRPAAVCSALLVALAGGCVLPSERGADARVILDPVPAVAKGDSRQLHARLEVDGRVVAGAEIAFSSERSDVLLVDRTGRLAGVGYGSAAVYARATAFGNARADSLIVKVRDVRFDVDSLWPTRVLAGDTLNILGPGLGLDSVFAVRIAGRDAELIARQGETLRVAVPVVRVASPERAAIQAAVAVTGFLGTRRAEGRVEYVPVDRFEPNEFAPAHLGVLSGPLVFPFLVWEALTPDQPFVPGTYDWYRFINPVTQDVSVIVRSDDLARFEYTAALAPVLIPGVFPFGRNYLSLGPLFGQPIVLSHGGTICQWRSANIWGHGIDPGGDGRILMHQLPAGSYDLVVQRDIIDNANVGYRLTIEPGANAAVVPDAAEENDACELATPVTLPVTGARYTLDHADDLDWFRFTLAADDTVRLSTTSDSTGVTVEAVWVFHASPVGFEFLLDGAFDVADRTQRRLFLAAGSYLLMVRGNGAAPYRLDIRAGGGP